MAFLYIASEAGELKAFANRLTGVRPLKWPLDYAEEGILRDHRVILTANGAGPKLAARALEVAIRAITAADLQSSELEGVVSVGYCGGLIPQLQPGQIVVASEIVSPGEAEIFSSLPVSAAGEFTLGRIVSQDSVAVTANAKKELQGITGGIAVEMESFGIARRAKRAFLPFFCIKAVSDASEESFALDLNRSRSEDGRLRRGKIVLQAFAKPSAIPELFRLKRRADAAGEALGEFLVSCRFDSRTPDAGGSLPGSGEGSG